MKKKSFRWQLSGSIIKSGVLAFAIAIILSILVFFPILRNNAIESAEDVNSSVIQHINNTLSFAESYTENIAVAVDQNNDIRRYLTDPSDVNRTKASVALNNFVSYMGMIRGIALAFDNLPVLDSITNFTEDDKALLASDFFEKMQKPSFNRSYSAVYETTVRHDDYYTVVYARNFYLSNHWCTIFMFVNLNSTVNDLKSLTKTALDAWYLTDNSGEIFYSFGEEKELEEAEKAVAELGMDEHKTVHGDIIFSRKSTVNEYGIVSVVKSGSITAILLPYTLGLFFAMLFFLILTLAFTMRKVNALINPVIELSAHMLRAAEGDLECKVETTREDEIGLLEVSFNKMIDDLKKSIEVIGEKEAREQKIKFSMLVSQIDPHFIYNTINSINYLARKERYADIVKVNTALIAILRDRLRVNDIQNTDTVANEMRVVNQYLEIEKFMYGGNLSVIWKVDEALMEEQIPKNMIQPLVENSLFHGLLSEENGEFNGKITIYIQKEDGENITLCVEDNGTGMDAEQLYRVRNEYFNPEDRGTRIGLANIRGRLYYLYNHRDCLEIESEPEKGTRITITFWADKNGK